MQCPNFRPAPPYKGGECANFSRCMKTLAEPVAPGAGSKLVRAVSAFAKLRQRLTPRLVDDRCPPAAAKHVCFAAWAFNVVTRRRLSRASRRWPCEVVCHSWWHMS